MKTSDRFWLRRHRNGWTSVVHRHPDGQFSAGGVHRWGGVHQHGIADLEFAKVKADADVHKKAPHSCENERCEPWPARRVQPPASTPQDTTGATAPSAPDATTII